MTNHLNLLLRDQNRRDLIERDNTTDIMRLGLLFTILFSLIFILIGRGAIRSWRPPAEPSPTVEPHPVARHPPSTLSTSHEPGMMLALCTSRFVLIGLGMLWYTLRDHIWYIRQRAQARMGTVLDVSAREDEGLLSITLKLQLDGADTTLSYTWSDNARRGKLQQIGQRIATLYHSDEELRLA